MIRNTQTNRAALGMLQAARHFFGRLQNEGVTARRIIFQQPKLCIVDPCIARQFRQIMANQSHVMLVVNTAYLANARNRIFIIQMTTQGIT